MQEIESYIEIGIVRNDLLLRLCLFAEGAENKIKPGLRLYPFAEDAESQIMVAKSCLPNHACQIMFAKSCLSNRMHPCYV